jgi:RNA polymerase sigma-70 factor (ECF subfamily)
VLTNLSVPDLDAAKGFYTDFLGLDTEEFNLGWVARYSSPDKRASVQLVTGDLQDLVDLLAPDVVVLGDGGGIKQALPRPVVGADRVARLLAAGMATGWGSMTAELTQVNGWPALILRLDGQLDSVLSMRVEDGLVTGIYTVRNPEKLTGILREVQVSR